MQYASAVALASLSGKAPSNSTLIQPRTPSPLFSRPLESPSMMLKSMQSLSPLTIEKLRTYSIIYPGHQQRSEQSQCRSCTRCPRCQGGKEEGREKARAQEGGQEGPWTRTRWRRRLRNGSLRLIHVTPYLIIPQSRKVFLLISLSGSLALRRRLSLVCLTIFISDLFLGQCWQTYRCVARARKRHELV